MKTTPPQKPSNTVYISNLSYERDRNGLRSMFARFGQIINIKIVVEPSTNQSRGMAFVEMSSIKEATAAIAELDGKVFDGRTVKCKYAIPMRETSKPKLAVDKEEKKKVEKDLDFKSLQLAKKAKNDKKRKSDPFDFKNAAISRPKTKTKAKP